MDIPGFPGIEVLNNKKCVVIECKQNIPCNPCESACPHHAISIGNPITNLPVVDPEKCIGCGLCVAQCPGQACFLVDMSHEEYIFWTFRIRSGMDYRDKSKFRCCIDNMFIADIVKIHILIIRMKFDSLQSQIFDLF